ncbi:hypothetical protein H6G97_51105 [Nostoc flagelliforme FACHB-838]|uniref:Transposase n=1 Tax=Nostoc flagelliforme FACHB-838 TaxID=2692904 RepID=A0ABR8E6K9_9NOSO|nr:hypothetical protein [Nostoc flagelliforme]MBD2537098.1 hypothetical protein [Nostoc flagelliforme FACHB-838]
MHAVKRNTIFKLLPKEVGAVYCLLHSKGTTATATPLEFIELYLGDSQDKAGAIGGNNLD